VGREINRLPNSEAIMLFYDIFLLGGAEHVRCMHEQDEDRLSRIIPKFRPFKKANLQVEQTDSLPKFQQKV
jgi:hypothetical protein